MKVYKYCSIDSAIKIIKSGGVRLSTRDKFNDPYDSEYVIDDGENLKTSNLIKDYFVFNGFCNWLEENKNKMNEIQLNNYNLIENEIKIVKNKAKETLELNINRRFLSYYEIFPDFYKNIDKIKADNKKKISNIIQNVLKTVEEALIGCFSKRNDSILMWSHYGDSHKGACIEFEIEDVHLKDIEYRDEKPKFGLYFAVEKVLISDLLNDKEILKNNALHETILKPFYFKARDWSYECETRFVTSSKAITSFKDLIIYDGEYYLLNLKINKIYLGTNFDKNDITSLTKLYIETKSKYKNVDFICMQLKKYEYKIVPNYDKHLEPDINITRDDNSLKIIKNEIVKSLDNECYLSALFLGLSVPSIIGNIIYPNLNEKEKYLEFFKKYEEEFIKNNNSEDFESIYFNGEICYRLKDALQNRGCLIFDKNFENFKIENFNLLINDERSFEIFTLCNSIDSNNNYKEFDFNIRYFLKEMIREIDNFLNDNKSNALSTPSIPILDYDEKYNIKRRKFIETKLLENNLNIKIIFKS